MRRLAGLTLALLAGCGAPPQRGPMTLAAADYRVKSSPSGSMLDRAHDEQEKAAREWIEGHLPEVDAAMSQGNPNAALGIATTLHKVAIDRKLTKLDAEVVQPVLARVVREVIASSTTTDRAELQGLLGFLDAEHDVEARAAAGLKFNTQAEAQRELAKAAEASGHKLALYLHRALVDYYSMTRVENSMAKEADVRAATAIEYTVMDNPDCMGIQGTINDFNRAHATGGRTAKLHVRLSRCSVDVVGDEVTRETKKFGRFSAGSSTTCASMVSASPRRSQSAGTSSARTRLAICGCTTRRTSATGSTSRMRRGA